MDVEALLRPVVEAAGLELVDAAFTRERGRRILRVTVDRDSTGGVDHPFLVGVIVAIDCPAE